MLNSPFNPEQLNSMISAIPGCISFKNLSGAYELCNTEALRTAELKESHELIGKKDQELWPILSDEIVKNDQKVIRSDKALQLEEAILFNNGRLKKYLAMKTPVRNEENKLVGIMVNAIEVTRLDTEDLSLVAEQSLGMLLKKIHFKRFYFSQPLQGNYLTKREAQCLICLARGFSTKEIATYFKISYRTVETHMENIKLKTHCINRAELTDLVFKTNFFNLSSTVSI